MNAMQRAFEPPPMLHSASPSPLSPQPSSPAVAAAEWEAGQSACCAAGVHRQWLDLEAHGATRAGGLGRQGEDEGDQGGTSSRGSRRSLQARRELDSDERLLLAFDHADTVYK
eukprot:scaffold61031_cov18-Tisochrysis_lutea.AAC.2